MCHAAEPGWQGVSWPPKGVVLETPAQIAHEAPDRPAIGFSHANAAREPEREGTVRT